MAPSDVPWRSSRRLRTTRGNHASVPADRLPFSNSTHIGVVDDHGAKVMPVARLRRHFGVADLIRLHAADFALLAMITVSPRRSVGASICST